MGHADFDDHGGRARYGWEWSTGFHGICWASHKYPASEQIGFTFSESDGMKESTTLCYHHHFSGPGMIELLLHNFFVIIEISLFSRFVGIIGSARKTPTRWQRNHAQFYSWSHGASYCVCALSTPVGCCSRSSVWYLPICRVCDGSPRASYYGFLYFFKFVMFLHFLLSKRGTYKIRTKKRKHVQKKASKLIGEIPTKFW